VTATELFTELRNVLDRQPLAATELRPAPPDNLLADTARRIGVRTPDALIELYRMYDGAHPEGPGHPGFFVFPPWWEWLPLSVIAAEGHSPVVWCRRGDVEAFPFAGDGTGAFLAADTEETGKVWWVTPEDPPSPAWPDGTLTGLITATVTAFDGASADYRLEYVDDRMKWIASWQPEF
jgi:SMI1/KNR4 family protein SUKH-1